MKIGDRVSWTRVRYHGLSINMTSVEGVIEAIHEDTAIVKRGNRRHEIRLSKLRLASDRNELTEMVLGKKE
jgi:hypothetical protein